MFTITIAWLFTRVAYESYNEVGYYQPRFYVRKVKKMLYKLSQRQKINFCSRSDSANSSDHYSLSPCFPGTAHLSLSLELPSFHKPLLTACYITHEKLMCETVKFSMSSTVSVSSSIPQPAPASRCHATSQGQSSLVEHCSAWQERCASRLFHDWKVKSSYGPF